MEKTNPRVLIAEDNPINQEIIKFILERHGFKFAVVENGLQAIKMLEYKAFDVILMDMEMPVMDGCEATKIIRQSEQSTGRHIKIIALTANDTDANRELCSNAGMDGYLTKPADPDLMVAMLKSDASLSMPIRQIDLEEKPAETAVIPETLNVSMLYQSVLGQTLPSVSMATLFLKELPELLAEVDDGMELNQFEQVARSAHRMGGAAAVIGAEQLALIAEELESSAKAGASVLLESLNKKLKSAAVLLSLELQAFLDRQI